LKLTGARDQGCSRNMPFPTLNTATLATLCGCWFACVTGANSFASDTNSLLVNGDFEAGDFSGWTLTTTPRGTIWQSTGAPQITSFATRKNSEPSRAATLNVGQDYQQSTGVHTRQGGYLSQTFWGPAGTYSVTLAVAVGNAIYMNDSGGNFTVFMDGVTLTEYQFGSIYIKELQRATLSGSSELSAGWHTLSIQVDRPYTADEFTPYQYIDNVVVSVPEPSSMALTGLIAAGVLGRAEHRRMAGSPT